MLANSAPITVGDANIIVEDEKANYYTEKKSNDTVLYVPKGQDSLNNTNIQAKFESVSPNVVQNQPDNIIVEQKEVSAKSKAENKKNKHSEKKSSAQNSK